LSARSEIPKVQGADDRATQACTGTPRSEEEGDAADGVFPDGHQLDTVWPTNQSAVRQLGWPCGQGLPAL